MARALLVR